MGKKSTKRRNSLPKRLNAPFDPRMLTIGPPRRDHNNKPIWPKLRRGHIRHAPDNDVVFGRVGFLYNPSTISVSHSIDPNQVADEVTGGQNQDSGITLGNTVGIGDVSIPLLFDRTYEVWERKSTEVAKFGVYHDVAAFYHMIGLTGSGTLSGALAQVMMVDGVVEAKTYPVQAARPTKVYASIGASLKYYGQITGLNVTYTHWSEDMIPMRCAVEVGIMLLPDTNQKSKKIGKTATGNTIDGTAGGVGGLLTQGIQ